MYTPKHFREEDLPKLHAFMQANIFATLVTVQENVPIASHLPFLLSEEQGAYGTLYAHMARANPQWRLSSEAAEALVIFQGPHAYITPSWYSTPLNVPTWNYAAVHAYGIPRIITDSEEHAQLLARQVQQYESSFEQPWPYEDLPADYAQKLMGGTVSFAIEISRLEGKAKLSQNKPRVDQEHVSEMLATSDDPASLEIAHMMQERLQK